MVWPSSQMVLPKALRSKNQNILKKVEALIKHHYCDKFSKPFYKEILGKLMM